MHPAINQFKPIYIMNTDIHPKSPVNPAPQAAGEILQRATDLAKDTCQTLSSKLEEGVDRSKEYAHQAANATKDTASRATEVAKDIYQSTAIKAEDTLALSREYVRKNPMTVVLGAIAIGATFGYMLMMARRKPTFGERYADEPLSAVREALLGALTPVAHRVHEGYESARDGAGKVMDQVHGFKPGRACDSFSDQLGRIGNNLKFW